MPLSDVQQLQLEYAYKDAAEKTTALPGRLRDEFEQAHAESREPYPIQPLTEIPAPLVVACIEAIGDANGQLADIIGAQRCCYKLGDMKVYLHSDQVKMLIDGSKLLTKSKAVSGA